MRYINLAVMAFVFGTATTALGGKVALVDASGGVHGNVNVNLARGSIRLKATSLAPLPATVDTGSGTFTAHLYKTYLSSSTDAAVEVSLGDLFPNGKQRAVQKAKLRGDLSQMGLDRFTVTAFSKDGQSAFDVLTATLP